MLSITLEGSPFERGYQHGQRFAAEIVETIRVFCPAYWKELPEIRELERRLLTSLTTAAPDLIMEMVGISKGSGASFDQITLLNLILATNDLSSGSLGETFQLACSAIGFTRSEHGPLAAKNCDETTKAAPFYLFQTVKQNEGLSFMGISWVGTIWLEAGLNEAGLALMQTAAPLVAGQDGYGIVCNIVPRLVLTCSHTVQEGVAALEAMKVAGWGMGAVLVDSQSNLSIVEKTYNLTAVRPAENGVGFITNHFLAPIMAATVPTAHEGLEQNSKDRYQTLTSLFKNQDRPYSLAGMKAALSYHGELGFVCQHGGAGMHSNYSCIALPAEKRILLGNGYPCLDQYTEYHI